MAKIEVHLVDHLNRVKRVKIESSASVASVREAVVQAMDLPTHDSQRRRQTFHLMFNNRQLPDDQTLDQAGVRDGGILHFFPELVAGGLAATPVLIIEDSVAPAPSHLGPEASVAVAIAPSVLRTIMTHAHTRLDHEVGGILLGESRPDEARSRWNVTIRRSLIARHTRATAVSLVFTAETWMDLHRRLRRGNVTTIVGWYHSHPGYGIFLSATDSASHTTLFNAEPWYLAMVVDPTTSRCGFFYLAHGQMRPCETADTLPIRSQNEKERHRCGTSS